MLVIFLPYFFFFFVFRRLISDFAWPIITELCRVIFISDPH